MHYNWTCVSFICIPRMDWYYFHSTTRGLKYQINAIFFPSIFWLCCFLQYVPHAEDSVLGIIVDSRSDVRKFIYLFCFSVHSSLLALLYFLVEINYKLRGVNWASSFRISILKLGFQFMAIFILGFIPCWIVLFQHRVWLSYSMFGL